MYEVSERVRETARGRQREREREKFMNFLSLLSA